MKPGIVFLALCTLALAEPPVSYLPPSSNYGAPRPSSLYGSPGINTQTTAIIKPNNQYGAPISQSGGHGSHFGGGSIPSAHYGAPSSNRASPNQQYGAPSSQYGAPGGGYGGGYDESQSEPANYQFEYHVQDASYGTDFGHQESRQGDVAQGRYFVLLPDGRRQIVDYIADQGGYRPKVSYEGSVNNNGGYSGGQGGGYSGGHGGGYSGGGGHHNGGGNGGYQY